MSQSPERMAGARLVPRGLDHADVFGIGLRAADFHEAAAQLLHDEVVAEGLYGVELAVVPGAFEELQHEHAHAVADGAQCGAHGGGGLAFAGAGVDEDESASTGRRGNGAFGGAGRKGGRAFGARGGARFLWSLTLSAVAHIEERLSGATALNGRRGRGVPRGW